MRNILDRLISRRARDLCSIYTLDAETWPLDVKVTWQVKVNPVSASSYDAIIARVFAENGKKIYQRKKGTPYSAKCGEVYRTSLDLTIPASAVPAHTSALRLVVEVKRDGQPSLFAETQLPVQEHIETSPTQTEDRDDTQQPRPLDLQLLNAITLNPAELTDYLPAIERELLSPERNRKRSGRKYHELIKPGLHSREISLLESWVILRLRLLPDTTELDILKHGLQSSDSQMRYAWIYALVELSQRTGLHAKPLFYRLTHEKDLHCLLSATLARGLPAEGAWLPSYLLRHPSPSIRKHSWLVVHGRENLDLRRDIREKAFLCERNGDVLLRALQCKFASLRYTPVNQFIVSMQRKMMLLSRAHRKELLIWLDKRMIASGLVVDNYPPLVMRQQDTLLLEKILYRLWITLQDNTYNIPLKETYAMGFFGKLKQFLSSTPQIDLDIYTSEVSHGGFIEGMVTVEGLTEGIRITEFTVTVSADEQEILSTRLQVDNIPANAEYVTRGLMLFLPRQLPNVGTLRCATSVIFDKGDPLSAEADIAVEKPKSLEEILEQFPWLGDPSSEGFSESVDDLNAEITPWNAGAYTAVKPIMAQAMLDLPAPANFDPGEIWSYIVSTTGANDEDIAHVDAMLARWTTGMRERPIALQALSAMSSSRPEEASARIRQMTDDDDHDCLIGELSNARYKRPEWLHQYIKENIHNKALPKTRRAAIKALSNYLEEIDVRRELLKLARDDDPEIAESAVDAMALFHHHEPAQRVMNFYKELMDRGAPEVRRQIITNLHWLPESCDEDHHALLLKADNDEDPRVRDILGVAVYNCERRSPEIEKLAERIGVED